MNSRKITAILLLIGAAAQHLCAQLPLPIYEPFPASYTNGGGNIAAPQGGPNYPSKILGEAVNSIQSVWSLNPGTGGGSAQILGGPAALSYPGLATNPVASVGVYIRTNDTTASRSRGILFPAITAGPVYASFLMNVEQLPATTATGPRIVAALSSAITGSPSGSGVGVGVGIDAATNFVVSLRSLTVALGTNSTLFTSGTHLIVMRYTLNPAANDDEIGVWVDPVSLGGSEPTANVLLTNTAIQDQAQISSFYIHHPGTEVFASVFMDEIRIGTNWAQVTPTGAVCDPASFTFQPTNATVYASISANFAVTPGGTVPTTQWQLSTDNGTSWNNLANATNVTYTTPNLAVANSGQKYRALITVPCNSSSTTSSVVSVTVLAPVVTPDGLVVDDSWQDGSRTNLPYATNNSVWRCSSSTTSLSEPVTPGALLGTTAAGSSRLWLGYFTDDINTNLPVHLDVGKTMKATLVFSAANIVATGGSLRFGLYDYVDGGARPKVDNFGSGSTGNAFNVRGYMAVLSFGTTFNTDTPISLQARTDITQDNLMSVGYTSLGTGPGGVNGQPAFQNGTSYTLEFSVKRTAANSVDITTKFTDGVTNWSVTVTDTNNAYHRFDTIGIRPNSLETTADNFTFSDFKVEVLNNSSAVTPIPVAIAQNNGNVVLTWSNPAFALQSSTSVASGYTTIVGATSPYTNPPSGTQKFFRLLAP